MKRIGHLKQSKHWAIIIKQVLIDSFLWKGRCVFFSKRTLFRGLATKVIDIKQAESLVTATA